jgi:hypothetical protein
MAFPITSLMASTLTEPAKDLIDDGYVGRVLSATMIAYAPNWGATIDRGYPNRASALERH